MASGYSAVAARRSPVQERSQETVQRILDAASRLLERGSLEEVTTSRVAVESGVSVGGLYRFFPDRQSIIDAIAVRHMNEFESHLLASLEAAKPEDGPKFMDTVIDAYVAFLDAHADFRTIALGQHISAETRARESRPDVGPAGLVRQFMIGKLGALDTSDLTVELRVAIETGERLLGFAYQQPTADERARVILELKRILSRYLFT